MKQIGKTFTILLLMLSVLNVSFGMVEYSHVCKTTQEQKKGFTKQDCEMDMKQEVIKPSCHKPMSEPCCEDSSVFDTQDQNEPVQPVSLLFFHALVQTILLPFEDAESTNSFSLVDDIPRPPNLRLSLVYQHILC